MSDSKIILEFLFVVIPDDHPALYQYIMGGDRSKVSAVNNIAKVVHGIFSPPYSDGHIRTVIRTFLKQKKHEHQKGLIKIKPIY
jgi:hypothetical protein